MADLYILAAGMLWGLIALFVNGIKSYGFNSLQCVAIRVCFTACVMVILVMIKDRKLLEIKVKDLLFFFGTGVCSIVFFNFCYFAAISEIGGAAVPALLLYTAPVFVMLMSKLLFGEPLTKAKIVAMAMTFAGLCLVTGVFSGGGHVSSKGILLGLASGFGYALYSIFGKFVVDRYSAMTITTYTFITASVVTVPFSGVLHQLPNLFTTGCMMYALGLAVCCTVLPFLLYTKGLTKTEAGKAAILATIEPVVALVVGVTVFGERMDPIKLTGVSCVILAIGIMNFTKRQKMAN